jgi:hypothetical protein
MHDITGCEAQHVDVLCKRTIFSQTCRHTHVHPAPLSQQWPALSSAAQSLVQGSKLNILIAATPLSVGSLLEHTPIKKFCPERKLKQSPTCLNTCLHVRRAYTGKLRCNLKTTRAAIMQDCGQRPAKGSSRVPLWRLSHSVRTAEHCNT